MIIAKELNSFNTPLSKGNQFRFLLVTWTNHFTIKSSMHLHSNYQIMQQIPSFIAHIECSVMLLQSSGSRILNISSSISSSKYSNSLSPSIYLIEKSPFLHNQIISDNILFRDTLDLNSKYYLVLSLTLLEIIYKKER